MNMNTTRNKQLGIIDLDSVMFQLLFTVLKAMGHAGVIGLVFIAPSITTVVTLQVVGIPMVVTLIIIVLVQSCNVETGCSEIRRVQEYTVEMLKSGKGTREVRYKMK